MCVQHKSHICLICLLLYCVCSHAHDHHEHAHHISDDEIDRLKSDDPLGDESQLTVDTFVMKLMNRYGDGHTMSLAGFSHLLYHLGLGGSVVLNNPDNYGGHEHDYHPNAETDHSDHDHEHDHDHDHSGDQGYHDHDDHQIADYEHDSMNKIMSTDYEHGELYDKNDHSNKTEHDHEEREIKSSKAEDGIGQV